MSRPKASTPPDTSSEAAAFQERLFLEMTPSQRVRVAFELSVGARSMARAGLVRRSGALTEDELTERLIELWYGGHISR